MLIQCFEFPGLAQYSYLIGSNGAAVVIDPARNIDQYREFAEEKKLKITHVLETHIHADFASGTTALTAATGAEAWLSGNTDGQQYTYAFPHHSFKDGEELHLGDLRIVALHTPGHTPEHLSFLVYEKSRCGQPLALFSGDFIFVGSLGRPDLLGAGGTDALASSLYESTHQKIALLPDGTEILPGHGAGSLCGAGMSERPQSTLGYERQCNIFMAEQPKEQFVETILRTVPPFPAYYKRMKTLNAQGAVVLPSPLTPLETTATEFQRLIEEDKAMILDVRSPEAFGGAHIPGSYNIGAGANLALWAGWVLPYGKSIYIVGDTSTDIEAVHRSLTMVGHDQIGGFLINGINTWIAAGYKQAHIAQISVQELNERLSTGARILDVRSDKEWQNGHVEDALHIPGGDLPQRYAELPSDLPLHVICGSGYRSSIACSVLLQNGFSIVNVLGGMTAWNAQNLPTTK